ncbi:hypothetical protein CVT25_002021 [Psilocybe cyanescens]|uniref:DUF6534 domain-containing protein n=1 Tax=Psilocybe cyanescens TaxID=93625 RepID=A0A409X045_PSICY|nr:hypothetical protein CVT25_002021 [Psilocybe cyanescens]
MGRLHSPTPGGLHHIAFPTETFFLKAMVYTVYGLEMAQTILVSKTLFNTFVYNFFNTDALDQIFDLWFSVPIIGGIVACIVQLFYLHRIVVLRKYLSSSKYLRTVIAVVVTVITDQLSLRQLAGGIALGIEMQQLARFSLIKTPKMWLGGEALCDILISVCITLILVRSKSQSASKSTLRHARKLIRLTIETGVVTGAVDDFRIFCVRVTNKVKSGNAHSQPPFVMDNGRKLYYQTRSAAVSKLYSNTLLVPLNSRMYLASEETLAEEEKISRSLEFSDMLSQAGSRARESLQLVVMSETVTREDRRMRFRLQ